MNNKLIRATIAIAIGVGCLTVSTLTKNGTVEKWSSFFFGFSFPMFLAGLVLVFQYYKKKREDAKTE